MRVTAALLLLAALAAAVPAQLGPDPVSVEVAAPAGAVTAGSELEVAVTITVDEPWHVYTDDPGGEVVAPVPTEVTPGALPAGVRWLGVVPPEDHEELVVDYGGGLVDTYRVWHGTFALRARLAIAETVAPGRLEVPISIGYQACDDTSCLLPTTVERTATVAIAAPPEPEAQAADDGAAAGDGGADAAAGAVEDDATGGAGAAASAASADGGGDEPAQGPEGPGGPAPAPGPLQPAAVTPTPAEPERAVEGGAPDTGGSGASRPAPEAGPRAPDGEADIEARLGDALARGDLGAVLGLSVVAALLALLTPCVFPMIPITVSFFTKRAEAGHGATSYALVYGLGIVATYTGFGLLLALASAGAAQTFATNPWVNFAVGALFVFFGLSLLGFYDIRPPRFLSRAAEGGMGGPARGGYLPVFVMGFVFTVTAFTCTAPVVGGLLAGLTTIDQPGLIVAGMLAFSTTFALPFVLLAIFPHALKALPGAGGWMVTVKVAMGFVELVASLKFFSNVDRVFGWELMPRPTMLLFTVMLLAAFALYLFGTYRMPHEPAPVRVGKVRVACGIAVTLLCGYLTTGMTGKTLNGWVEAYLPPIHYGVPESEQQHRLRWHDDLDDALAEARVTGQNVFLDFTGITCVNCMKIERKVFDQPEFAAIAQDVVLARLYTDRRDEHAEADRANLRLMEERFGTVTLPFYVLLSPTGEVLDTKSNPPVDEASVETFAAFLRLPYPS